MGETMQEKQIYKARPVMIKGQPGIFLTCLVLVLLSVMGLLFWQRGNLSPQEIPIQIFVRLIPAITGTVALFIWWLIVLCTTLTVTEKRVILRKGILFKEMSEVLIQDIRNIQISQGPLQRLTNAGKVGISSAGQSDIEIAIQGILDPKGVKAIIDKYRKV
jgi:membrane protein YdbS with pleckstrin-like domain